MWGGLGLCECYVFFLSFFLLFFFCLFFSLQHENIRTLNPCLVTSCICQHSICCRGHFKHFFLLLHTFCVLCNTSTCSLWFAQYVYMPSMNCPICLTFWRHSEGDLMCCPYAYIPVYTTLHICMCYMYCPICLHVLYVLSVCLHALYVLPSMSICLICISQYVPIPLSLDCWRHHHH